MQEESAVLQLLKADEQLKIGGFKSAMRTKIQQLGRMTYLQKKHNSSNKKNTRLQSTSTEKVCQQKYNSTKPIFEMTKSNLLYPKGLFNHEKKGKIHEYGSIYRNSNKGGRMRNHSYEYYQTIRKNTNHQHKIEYQQQDSEIFFPKLRMEHSKAQNKKKSSSFRTSFKTKRKSYHNTKHQKD